MSFEKEDDDRVSDSILEELCRVSEIYSLLSNKKESEKNSKTDDKEIKEYISKEIDNTVTSKDNDSVKEHNSSLNYQCNNKMEQSDKKESNKYKKKRLCSDVVIIDEISSFSCDKTQAKKRKNYCDFEYFLELKKLI